jgi:hypothetical protein
MAEPLLGRQPLVASRVPGSDLVTVSSGAGGPAGSVGLDLGDGVEVDVDAAPPHRLVNLTIDLRSGDRAAPPLVGVRHGLDVLLGPDCGADVVAFLADARHDDTRPTLAPLGAGAGGGTAASPGAAVADPHGDDASDVAPPIYRAAIVHGIACAAGAAPLVRAVALLEGAVELAAVGRVLGIDGVVRGDVRIGVELLLDEVARGSDPMPGGRAGREVARLLRRVSGLGGVQSVATARLRSLARELERAGPHRPGAPGLAPGDGAGVRVGAVRSQRVDLDGRSRPRRSHRHPASVHAGRPRMPGRVPLDIGTLPGSLAEAPVAASRTGSSEVEVRIDGWAERRGGLWARAFLAGDGSLLAVAPLRANARDAAARLLVPPNAIGRLEVDVTDQPELPRPSPALAAVQRAIHLGRAAAQAQRLGDSTTANLRWRQCARHWHRAGDHKRAELAHAFGAEAARSPGRRQAHQAIPPLVADLVAAEY